MTPMPGYYLEQDLTGLKNDRYQVEVALDKGSLNINQKPAPEEIASQINLMLTGNPQQRNTADSVTEPPQTKVETSDSSPSITSDEESDKATAEADGQSITDASEGDQNNTEQGGEQ